MRKKLIICLLGLHLFVFFSATSLVNFGRLPVAYQSAAIHYLAVTGGHPYNFFSPDIPNQIVVKCLIIDSAGKSYTETFDKNTNTLELRANYLFQLLDNGDDPETAAQIAAQYCFRHYKSAEKVKVSIGKFIVPSVADHEKGVACSFLEIFSETFPHE